MHVIIFIIHCSLQSSTAYRLVIPNSLVREKSMHTTLLVLIKLKDEFDGHLLLENYLFIYKETYIWQYIITTVHYLEAKSEGYLGN